MSRMTLPSIALSTVLLAAVVPAGCGGSGLNFWLYPAPHLEEAEEAIFLTYESHGLRTIDGQEAGSLCWDDQRRPQAYSRADVACRLHVRPGEHSAVVQTAPTSLATVTLTFTALAGRIYGVDRSACTTSTLTREARQQTCQMEIKEVGRTEPGAP